MFAFTRKDVDARVVGSALVVQFSGVDVQKTWRADMGALVTATLEVKEADKKFNVVMKRAGEEEVIAGFNDKESAAYTLDAISKAMLKGDTQIVAAQGGQAMAVVSKIFKGLVILLLVAIVFIVMGKSLFNVAPVPGGGIGGGDRSVGRVPPGEPMPLDDILGK